MMIIEKILRHLAVNLDNKFLLRRTIKNLDTANLRDCLEELLCHVDIHIAERCFKEADALLRLGKRLTYALHSKETSSTHFFEYTEKLMRRRCKWLDAQGLYIHSAKHLNMACRKYQKLPKSKRDDSVLGALCLDAALAYAGAGKTSQALRLARKAQKLFSQQNDTYNELTAKFNEASLLYDVGKYIDSNRACALIILTLSPYISKEQSPHSETFKKTHLVEDDRELMAKTILQLANNLEFCGDSPDETAKTYSQAFKAYYGLSNYKKQAEIAYRIGWLLKKSDRFEAALQYLKAAFIIRMASERKKTLMRQSFIRGKYLLSLGLYKRARLCFIISLFLSEQLQDSSYLTMSRFGFYKTGKGLGLNLRSAMTASALEARKPWSIKISPGGFRHYASDGYALPPYPETQNKGMSFKDKRSLINLINDLTFCAGAADSAEAPYYRAQQRAFRIY